MKIGCNTTVFKFHNIKDIGQHPSMYKEECRLVVGSKHGVSALLDFSLI